MNNNYDVLEVVQIPLKDYNELIIHIKSLQQSIDTFEMKIMDIETNVNSFKNELCDNHVVVSNLTNDITHLNRKLKCGNHTDTKKGLFSFYKD